STARAGLARRSGQCLSAPAACGPINLPADRSCERPATNPVTTAGSHGVYGRYAKAQDRNFASRASDQEIADGTPDRAPVQPGPRTSRQIAYVPRIAATPVVEHSLVRGRRTMRCTMVRSIPLPRQHDRVRAGSTGIPVIRTSPDSLPGLPGPILAQSASQEAP